MPAATGTDTERAAAAPVLFAPGASPAVAATAGRGLPPPGITAGNAYPATTSECNHACTSFTSPIWKRSQGAKQTT